MNQQLRLSDEILRHYAAYDERARLTDELGRVEEARSREITLRHLPPPPARVLDVGGGPGRYAHWLAGLGYEVHLSDPVPRHVDQALEDADPAHPLASAVIGDARALGHEDASCDAVLLLGPLYHLPDRDDRLRALGEALRVLVPGGPVLAAGISRFASILDGLNRGFIDDPLLREMVIRDLATGRHVNPGDDPAYFTTAFFHHPDELAEDLTDAGFEAVAVLAVEGIAWVTPDLGARWADDGARAFLEDLLRDLEREPSLLGASPHLLGVGCRPSSGN